MKLRTKFQDEDFELGEVVDATIMYGYGDKIEVNCIERNRTYNSIKDFTDHWEDAPEEPDEWWYIDRDGVVDSERRLEDSGYNAKQIGNYFGTEEEARKAVEKLKALKRLKDKGFMFTGWYSSGDTTSTIRIYAGFPDVELGPIEGNDLALLFGGEE